ncbi:MAG: hypothetical protein U1E15_06760 [Hyphomicrobiales bacterium]
MSRTSIVAILATVGIVFTGEITTEAMAFARAVQSDDEVMFNRFVKQFPDSQYRGAAEQLAFACKTNWVGGACGLYGSGSKGDGTGGQGSSFSGGTLPDNGGYAGPE